MTKHTAPVLILALFLISCRNNTDPNLPAPAKDNKKAINIKEKWHWGNEQKQDKAAGYTQVVKIGNTLYISGIPTSDLSQKGISELYASLGKCLNAFGASAKDVVKETLYTTDIASMKSNNDARKAFYQNDYPAASWVQVSRLYEQNAKVEVDLIAVLPEDDQ